MGQMERIVLEPAGDQLYRLTVEGEGEGQAPQETLTIEPAEKRDGEQLYHVTVGGQDVQAHAFTTRWSDRSLKTSIRPLA